ncbi:hypothetical protein FHG66_03195 [Rubellimicrobium rubrum]|uniref:HdeA/HdeB family protein n=1 Tax=Rubellimicrobium rubrum TaxID=2585369 RepID=A0A5C4MZT6_9RHOB|nr:hypothetical protein [Rubellimicrobium rubrum]TNC51833.1 hypothetical protein FHG66_03195 [Rubellimicrobium rubrum]
MKLLIQLTALFGVFATAVFAQDATPDYATMTCADFLTRDGAAQMATMVSLRAAMNGAVAGAKRAATTGSDATAVNVTGDAAEDGMEAAPVADTASVGADTAADATQSGETGAASPHLSAMRTSCENAPDTLAVDAITAANATVAS